MSRSIPRAQLCAVLFLVATPVVAQGLTPIQVAKLRYVTEVWDLGAAGVLFARSEPRLAKDPPGSSRLRLYLLAPKGEEKLLMGGDTGVRGVSVRGGKVYTLQKLEEDKVRQIYEWDPQTGKTTRITGFEKNVLSYKWSPDGKHIAYTVLAPVRPHVQKARKAGFGHTVVDEDFRHVDLWVLGVERAGSRRLTTGGTVFSFEWAPDSTKLAVGMAPRNLVDDRYMFTRLFQVDLAKGAIQPIVENPGKLGDYAWSPDGRSLAYVSADNKRDPHAGMLYVKSPDRIVGTCLTPGFRGMVHAIEWKGDRIHATVSRGVRTFYTWFYPEEVHGEVEPDPNSAIQRDKDIKWMAAGFDVPGLAFRSLRVTADGVLVTASTKEHPPEAYRITLPKKVVATRLTDSNPWLSKVTLGRQEVVRFKARDGVEIEGLLMYPINHEKQRYPMVIVVHGGPESHFSEGWNTTYSSWGQMLCARGYFAWYPNYRASTGYGVKFAMANHGDVMGGEFDDHLDALAHFDSQGLIHVDRVGIGGGSYGGYAAAWAATRHSKHFKAAVSFVPFVDIRTKWLTSDIPNEFHLVHYEEKWPLQQLPYLNERSPLTHAADCRTPLLLLGGTADTRVHPSQPFMLYRAVKFHTKTPVRYVQYPGEGHGNSKNTNRYDYSVRALRWFDHYLKFEGGSTLPDLNLDYSEWYATR